MNFAIVMEGMTFIAFLVVILGGKQMRERGWKVLSCMLLLAGVIQCAGMSLIVSSVPAIGPLVVQWTDRTQAYLYDNDDRFFPGWKLDTSWIFCTISWSVMVLTAAFISASVYLVAPEGGYELLPSDG